MNLEERKALLDPEFIVPSSNRVGTALSYLGMIQEQHHKIIIIKNQWELRYCSGYKVDLSSLGMDQTQHICFARKFGNCRVPATLLEMKMVSGFCCSFAHNIGIVSAFGGRTSGGVFSRDRC